MKITMRRYFLLVLLFLGNQSCSCLNNDHVRCYTDSKLDDAFSGSRPQVSKMLVRSLGFNEDKEGFNSTIRLGECNKRFECEWILDQISRSKFKDRFVPNWSTPYYLFFLTAKGDVICAVDCIDDNFQFVQAKKTFWSYYVGPIIPVQGSKWKPGDDFEWGEIPGFEKTVWRMCR
jgi:hypothetical protein